MRKYLIDFTQILLEYLLIHVSFLDNIFIRESDILRKFVQGGISHLFNTNNYI